MIGNERETVYVEPLEAPLLAFRAWRLGTNNLFVTPLARTQPHPESFMAR